MSARERAAAARAEDTPDGLRATRFDVLALGLTPLLAFATTSNSFSMEAVFPLTAVLVWRQVVRSYRFRMPLGSRWTPLCLFGFVWLGLTLLVNLFVDPDSIATIALIRWFYVGSALAFYCAATAPRFTVEDLVRALRLSVLSGVLVSLGVIASFLRGATGKISFETPLGGPQETNFTGSLLAILLLLGLVRLRLLRAAPPLDVAMLVPIAAAVLLTGSRAAAIATGVGLLLFLLLGYRFTTASTFRLVLGSGAVLVLGWMIFRRLPVWTVDRVLGNNYVDDSNLRRLELWRSALRGFLDSPILGHGVGTFVANPGETLLGVEPVTSHSTYLSVLVDGGIVWFVVVAVLVGSACLAVVRGRREFFGLVVCFGVVTMIVDASRMAFFWYGLVVLSVLGETLRRERAAHPEPDSVAAAAGVGATP